MLFDIIHESLLLFYACLSFSSNNNYMKISMYDFVHPICLSTYIHVYRQLYQLTKLFKILHWSLNELFTISGNWSDNNRSQELIQKKLDSPPPAPVWSPKSAPPSPTTDRKFRPVPFESPTLSRKKLSTKDCPSPPPWTDPEYKDKPYQGSIIKSSSLNTISSPRVQQQNHVIFRKPKGNKKKKIDIYRIHPICALEKFIHLRFVFLFTFPPTNE